MTAFARISCMYQLFTSSAAAGAHYQVGYTLNYTIDINQQYSTCRSEECNWICKDN